MGKGDWGGGVGDKGWGWGGWGEVSKYKNTPLPSSSAAVERFFRAKNFLLLTAGGGGGLGQRDSVGMVGRLAGSVSGDGGRCGGVEWFGHGFSGVVGCILKKNSPLNYVLNFTYPCTSQISMCMRCPLLATT